MIIDTQKSRIRIQLQKLLFLFLLVLFWVFLYTTTYFKQPVLGLERNYYAGAAALLYVLYYTTGYLRDANYIYFNNNSSKIIIRYFSLRPLSSEQSSIEISKQEFHKAEIVTKYGGFNKYLIIYQKTAKGIAKYAPVSISILNKKDVDQLARELNISR